MDLSAFGSCGHNVAIHESAVFFNPKRIHIGSDVRIDCFCMISAGEEGVYLGNHIHLGAGAMIFGSGGRVTLEDFAGISSRVTVYTATDDFVDGHLTNPTVPPEYRKTKTGPVTLRRHAIVGAGSILMPGVELNEGASVGALTLVSRSVAAFTVVFGSPMRRIATRNKERLHELERQFLDRRQQR